MRRGAVAGVCACILAAGVVQAQVAPPAQPAPDPQKLLAAGEAALGGRDAIANAADFEAEQTGWIYAQDQARDARDASTRVGRTYRWTFDVDGGRMRREAEQLFPGGIRFFTRAALSPGGGWSVDLLRWRTGVDLEAVEATAVRAVGAPWERMFPHLLLRQVRSAAGSLAAAGPQALTYRDPAGETVRVVFDPSTGLPTRAALMRDNAAVTEMVYGEYERRGVLSFPTVLQVRQQGQLQEDVRLGAVRFASVGDEAFTPPAGYTPPPKAGEPALRLLAPGVHFFEGMPNDYHSVAVDAGDHLILLEAPQSPAYAQRQLELLTRAAPGKPVRYVVVTHPHGDHTGGLKPWAEAGAVLVAPRGAAVALRRQLTARGLTRPVRIEEVEDRRTLGAGAGRVELHQFSSSHSEGNLLAYVPSARLLFQGDLLYVPERGEPPAAFGVVRELRAELQRRGLRPQIIVGVHGRPATAAEMELSLRRAEAR